MIFRTTFATVLLAATLASAVQTTAAPFAPFVSSAELGNAGATTVSGEQPVRARRAQTFRESFSAAPGTGTAKGYPGGNVAEAWTAGCYREFGPKAKWPDAGLLDWCLSF